MSIEEIFDVMVKDWRVRLSIARRSHKLFFYFYFPHYTEYKIAPFHDEMFLITQDTDIRNAAIAAFRGSGKSTIFSLSFPLWAIFGEQKLKYILLLGKTQQKAQTILQHVKYELETNEVLKDDLGPFQEERGEWNTASIYLPRYRARITVASAEQSIRGLRHMQYRPQLIICDDLEDLESVKTKEGRDKIHNWLVGDVIPAGGRHTRIIVVGGLLHEDSLIKRLEKRIKEEQMDGVYRAYPLLDENGTPTWLGKFPDQKSIDAEKSKGVTDSAWYREYLLKIIPDENQLIHEEWFKKYDVMPNLSGNDYVGTFIAIDPAGSDSETADCTAMVAASVFGYGEEMKIYIHPNPVNKRMRFNETKERATLLSKTLGGNCPATLIIEGGGVQKWLTQELIRAAVPVEEFKVSSVDKRSRLAIGASLPQAGKVFLPREGCKDLLQQLIGFGTEKRDDLADAFSMLMLTIMNKDRGRPQPFIKQSPSSHSTIFGDLMNKAF